MVSCKSHVRNLKTGCLGIQKKPSVGVDIRAGVGLRSEKAGWKASDKGQWPQEKKCLGIRFLPREFLLIVLLHLFIVSRMTNFNYDLLKVSKMTNFNYDLFKVSKMCIF